MFKFKSRADADLLMFDPIGRQLLDMMGKHDGARSGKGVLLPAEMPSALAALEQALRADDARRAQRPHCGNAAPEDASEDDAIPLRHRAAPLLAMIRRCHAADKEIVWGV